METKIIGVDDFIRDQKITMRTNRGKRSKYDIKIDTLNIAEMNKP